MTHRKLGLIGTDGAWGSNVRINDVLTFLGYRDLNAEGYPYQFYDASNGSAALSISSNETVDTIDTGRLFVALNNLINYNSNLAPLINNIVYNRTDYAVLVPGILSDSQTSVDIYDYYVFSGFASFWPQLSSAPGTILNNILSADVTYSSYGNVSLPDAQISCAPLLCSIFEIKNPDSRLMGLMNEVYLAHEAYFIKTGLYVAFSEGNGYGSQYIDEWVVLPNGNTWVITVDGSIIVMPPVAYTNVAFSFLAIYNNTYAQNLVQFILKWAPSTLGGYDDGTTNSNYPILDICGDTNGLILDAALYAIQNNP